MKLILWSSRNRTKTLAKNYFCRRSKTETHSKLQSKIVSSTASYPWLPDWKVNEIKSNYLRRMTRSIKYWKITILTLKREQTSTSSCTRSRPSTWRSPQWAKWERQSHTSSKSSCSWWATSKKTKLIVTLSRSASWPSRNRLSFRRRKGCDCSSRSNSIRLGWRTWIIMKMSNNQTKTEDINKIRSTSLSACKSNAISSWDRQTKSP